jgi:hypothetical protein
MTETELTKAALVKIVPPEGRKKSYLVMRVPSMPGESVTVTRDKWDDTEPPEEATDVVIEGLYKHRNGWRARKARRLLPTDDL